MTWADGSVYKGTWDNGIQDGLGVMTFANGIKKAGTFKENVLMELITDPELILKHETLHG